ncbi:gustatory receptor for sugar taste 64e-like [Bombyx mandarina]|uniref:Gustatory receptor for sugar taste 64e-like n=1 Tax=Bombyx mandarina TaxID=7092 RepID=A0A6J2K5T8_BOMMA|nr:gustatory receptor for sugar taste 64e-like [Bombyx mandarina]
MAPRSVRSMVGTSKKDMLKGGFYETVRIPLCIYRLIGILPISGLWYRSSKYNRFSLKSFYTIIYAPTIVMQTFLLLVHIYDLFAFFFGHQRLGRLIYHMNFYTITILIFTGSRKWENVIKEIETIELTLPRLRNSKKALALTKSFVFAFFVFSLAEVVLILQFTLRLTKQRHVLPGDSGLYLKSYFVYIFPYLYDHFPFSYVMGFIVQIIKVQGIITLNMVNCIVVLLSIYLTNRLKHYNRIVFAKGSKTKNTRPKWIELNLLYTKISNLVKIIDKHLNPFVFISFTANLSYICAQLFYILNKLTSSRTVKITSFLEDKRSDWETLLYISLSFALVVLKVLLVSIIAAEVHTTSREPLRLLYTLPTTEYTIETQRLMTQVYYSNLSLSGLNFFHITRGMLLGMVATLLTYEIVLLQI